MSRRKVKKRNNRSNRIVLFLGIIFIILGIVILLSKSIINKVIQKNENQKIEAFFENENSLSGKEEERNEENVKDNVDTGEEFAFVLEIPKINLKKGLYNVNSKFNDIEYNIEVMKESDLPDVENGNFILSGHNGNSSVSFFDKLVNLNVGDRVFVYYKSKKYEYKLENIYDVNKTGDVEIKRDTLKTTITLISCKNSTKNKQTVYIGYLVK